MIHYDDYNLQLIERAIRQHNNKGDYWRASVFAGVHKFRIVAQYQIWTLRPATLKRGPFESAFARLCE